MKWKSLFAAALAAAVAWPALAQDATGGGTPSLSFSFANGRVQDGTVERVTVVPAGNHTSLGIHSVPVENWIDLDDEAVTTSRQKIEATDVVAIGDTHANFTLPAPVYVAYSAANGWSYKGNDTHTFLQTYLDDGNNGASILVKNVPFTKYDVIVYLATDTASAKFLPVFVNGVKYKGTSAGAEIVTGNDTWGSSRQDSATLGTNALKVSGLETQTLTIRGSVGSGSGTTRCGIAAFQIIQASDGAIRDTATYQPVISVNMKGSVDSIVGTSGFSGLNPILNTYWNELPTSGTSESGVGFMDDSGLATSLAIDATYSGAQWSFSSSAGRLPLGAMANGYREVTTLGLTDVPYSSYNLILYYASDLNTDSIKWAATKVTSATDDSVKYYTYPADYSGTGAAVEVEESAAVDWGATSANGNAGNAIAYGKAVMLIEGLSGDIALEMLKNDNNRGGLYGFQIVCTGEVLTDKEPIAGIISVNARGTKATITSNTTTRNGTSGLDAFAVANANWNELTKAKETETLTGLKDAFGVATTADVTAYLGGKWGLSEGGGMNLIAERTERLGAMGDGYNDAGDANAANPIELALRDIPYETYDLVLYLCTDNTGQKWAPVEVISNGVSSYYTYTGEETDGAATKSASKPASWGTTNDIASTDNSGTLGHDVMLIKGLSGDIEVDMGTHNPTRGGLAGFQIIGRGKEIVPPTPEPVEEVPSINVNFASGRSSGTDHDHPLKGETGYGLYPVPGGEWDNVLYSQQGNAVTLTTNGFVVSDPVTLTFQATGAWEYSGTNNLLVNVLDDAANNNQDWCADIDIANVPFTEYSAIVYLYADAGVGFRPVEVNGKYYTYKDGALTKVEGYDQAHAFGNTTTREPVVGVNAVRVDELTGAFSLRTFKNGRSGSESLNTYARGNLAGFQLICTGEVIPTVDPAKEGVISLNFGSNQRAVPENETAYGLAPVAGNKWQNFSGEFGTDVPITRAENTDLAGAPTVTYNASTTYWTSPNNAHPFLQGYLDDGATSNGYGATISVANLPYSAYDVIVYAGYSDNGEDNIHPYEIDGTFYRWDDAKQTTVATTDTSAAASWGSLSATPVYGENALRVRGRLASTLSPLTVKGLPRLNQDAERGGIAALQIVERKLITENFANALAALAEDTPVYIRPTAQIAGDLTLPADAVLDLRYVAWDNPVVSGTLTLGANTMIRLPGGRVKYAIAEALAGATDSVQVFVHDDIMDSVGQLADGVTISDGTITRPVTYEWVGGTEGNNWSNRANWSSGVEPDENSAVTVTLAENDNKTITLDKAATVASLTITGPASGSATLTIATVEGAENAKLTVVDKMFTTGNVTVTQKANIAVNGATQTGMIGSYGPFAIQAGFQVNGAAAKYTIASGELLVKVPGTDAGDVSVSNGATLEVGAKGTLTAARARVTYYGGVSGADVTAGRLRIAGQANFSTQMGLSMANYTVDLAGGTLTTPSVLTFYGLTVSKASTLAAPAGKALTVSGTNSALTGAGSLTLQGTVVFSSAITTAYTGELTAAANSTVTLGENRPKLSVVEGATVNITPTAEEQAAGVVSFGTSMTADPTATFKVSGVEEEITPSVADDVLTLKWKSAMPTLATSGDWSASNWTVGEATGQAAPTSGTVVLDGTTAAIKVRLNTALTGMESILVLGNVTLETTSTQSTIPACVTPAEGATLTIDANISGVSLQSPWELPAGTTLKVTKGFSSFAYLTLNGKTVILEGASGSDGEPNTIEASNASDFVGGLTIQASNLKLTSMYHVGTVLELLGENIRIEGLEQLGEKDPVFYTNAGTQVVNRGSGNEITNLTGHNGSLAVEAGSLKLTHQRAVVSNFTGATIAGDATLTLAGPANAQQWWFPATGEGTLVLEGAYRPMFSAVSQEATTLPKNMVFTATAAEQAAGLISCLNNNHSAKLPEDFTVKVNPAEGGGAWVPNAVLEEGGNSYLRIYNVPAPNGLTGLDDEVALTLRQAAAKEGITNGNYTVQLRTKGGQTTIASPDAATLNDVLGCFTGLKATANAEGTTLTYAYDFGIVGIKRNTTGDGWVVTAKVQGEGAAQAGFAKDNYYVLSVTAGGSEKKVQLTGESSVDETSAATGTVELTVPDTALEGLTLDDGFTLGVSVSRTAQQL